MARQSTAPVEFARTIRTDESLLMTSGRAAQVVPVGYFPLLPGDTASGKVGIDVQLAEMPRPLQNGVVANFQAWCVPKNAMPQFSSKDEVMNAFTGKAIKTLGAADRTPPPFFMTISGATLTTAAASDFFRTLGIHVPTGASINTDLIDAFVQIYNFRCGAYSSKLPRRKFASEDIAEACALPRAFWPQWRLQSVVPDYERALVVGSLTLDVAAGRLPISGLGVASTNATVPAGPLAVRDTANAAASYPLRIDGAAPSGISMRVTGATAALARADVFAEMAGQQIGITLRDIDIARTTQAFAKLRTAYSSTDLSGFMNDDAIVATLMMGIPVDDDEFARPWLLDSAIVPVGFAERFATDGTNLDKSVTLGRASASQTCPNLYHR